MAIVLERLKFDNRSFERLTHYWIRYPAKFHPPVARFLVERYTRPNELILDPFCGSGSLLVEALACGRCAIGTDVDPLAVFATRVKTRRYSLKNLLRSVQILEKRLAQWERPPHRYFLGQFDDIKPSSAIAICGRNGLWIPPIPRLFDWFRSYVVVDLARILKEIELAPISRNHREFFRLAFAAIIRAASNADPVPVSGLEITSYIQQVDAQGRVINPFDLFRKKVEKAVLSLPEFSALVPKHVHAEARIADATNLARFVRGTVDAIITSPPYNNAVDYHRRHELETYWLRLVKNPVERSSLRDRYIGQNVSLRHRFVRTGSFADPLCERWHRHISALSPLRAAAFKHYVISMQRMFSGTARLLRKNGRALFVLGHSSWNGDEIPTTDLFEVLAGREFRLVEKLSYPVANRWMSYARKNGADINREYVLVFERSR